MFKMARNTRAWTDAEVQSLLRIYASEIQQDFQGSKRHLKIFGNISNQLAMLDIHHTPKQCREKIKKLKQDYKKIKDHNEQNGSDRKSSKWFDLLDRILGHRSTYEDGTERKCTPAEHLQAIASHRSTYEDNIEIKFTPAEHIQATASGSENNRTLTEACAEETHPESEPLILTCLIGDTPTLCSTPGRPSACTSPSRPSSPAPARTGKRKRDDTSILCLVKDMLRLEEEERRQSHAHFESLLDLLREQTEREAEENEQLRAEAAEARHQQAAFMEGLLTTINRLAAGTQGLRHPEVD